MYPQNTVPDMEEDPAVGFMHIPVGFAGHGQLYQWRISPEGEDVADIIGPDGHKEQLPPYTRYPDGIPPRHGLPGPASILSEERAIDTEIAEVGTPQERVTSRTAVVSGAPGSDNSTPDASGSFKEKLTKKGKKRVCRGCVPLWMFVLFLLLFLVGIVIGGVIGGITANKNGVTKGETQANSSEDESSVAFSRFCRFLLTSCSPSTVFSTVTATTFIDATPLLSPSPTF
jgi:hypothetical protein